MVMMAMCSFHYPETRGTAEGNNPGQGRMDTACIPK